MRVVAIGGYNALGKSALAVELSAQLGEATILPTDSFLPDRKTRRELGLPDDDPATLDTDGLTDALQKLQEGKYAFIRPYDHSTGQHLNLTRLVPSRFIILDGTSSLHPNISSFVDFRIFLSAQPDVLLELLRQTCLNERNYSEDEFNKFWDEYRSSSREFVNPTKRYAHVVDVTLSRKFKSPLIRTCSESG